MEALNRVRTTQNQSKTMNLKWLVKQINEFNDLISCGNNLDCLQAVLGRCVSHDQ